MDDSFAENYEYKVLEGIRAELAALEFRSHVVGSPDWFEPDGKVAQFAGAVPQFVLQVWADVMWRVWLYDGGIYVRNVKDNRMQEKGFDLADPNSISELFAFMGVS